MGIHGQSYNHIIFLHLFLLLVLPAYMENFRPKKLSTKYIAHRERSSVRYTHRIILVFSTVTQKINCSNLLQEVEYGNGGLSHFIELIVLPPLSSVRQVDPC